MTRRFLLLLFVLVSLAVVRPAAIRCQDIGGGIQMCVDETRSCWREGWWRTPFSRASEWWHGECRGW